MQAGRIGGWHQSAGCVGGRASGVTGRGRERAGTREARVHTRVKSLKLALKAHNPDTCLLSSQLSSAEAWSQVSFEGVCVPMQVANIART